MAHPTRRAIGEDPNQRTKKPDKRTIGNKTAATHERHPYQTYLIGSLNDGLPHILVQLSLGHAVQSTTLLQHTEPWSRNRADTREAK